MSGPARPPAAAPPTAAPPTTAPPTAAPGRWDAPSPTVPGAAQLDAELHRLLDFAAGARAGVGGFGHLDGEGRLLPDQPVQTWISARMTYCFALGALAGRTGDVPLVDHGLAALAPGGLLHDDAHGGWYAAASVADGSPVDTTKAVYAQTFVVLAAAAGLTLGRPGAAEVLDEALRLAEEVLWDDALGLVRESFAADWSQEEDYRGANANMHAVEAFLAAADTLDARGDTRGAAWRERALTIAERVVHGSARAAGWRMPEHFTRDGAPVLDYNTDDRAHPFRPYGVTPGHLLEWSRLLLHLRAGATPDQLVRAPWLLEDSRALYDTAVRDGWAPDGEDGFVYTTDFDGAPVTRARMHWVLTEAIGAAVALHQTTGEARYAEDVQRWWRFAQDHLVDPAGGSWHAELDEHLRPASGTWTGKPDVYHALQAVLVSRLPLAPVFAEGLARTTARTTAAGGPRG